MKIILLGAPGAGKGTQAENISDKLSIPIIGTGNLIREAVKQGTPAGLEAKNYMDASQLVPDEIVVNLLKERLSQGDAEKGCILDGFPRNAAQAEILENMGIKIDRVIKFDVPDETIVSRVSGRRVCGECGSSYHIEFKKPKIDGVCDRCGGSLAVRSDDQPEMIKERLKVYHEQTKPLVDYYSKQGILRTVVGKDDVADTTRLTLAALEE